MIIFDGFGHMVSTESAEELHAFAARIGLKRSWYQNPSKGSKMQKDVHPEWGCHYDLTTFSKRDAAAARGAEFVQPCTEIVKRAWWVKKER